MPKPNIELDPPSGVPPPAEHLEFLILVMEEVAVFEESLTTKYLRGAFTPRKLRNACIALQYRDAETVPHDLIEPRLLHLFGRWRNEGKPKNIRLKDFCKSQNL